MDLLTNAHIHYNLSIQELSEIAINKEGAIVADNGALVVNTVPYTGRSPKDRFIVDSPLIHDYVDWNEINQPISSMHFKKIYQEILEYIKNKELYVFDGFIGADKEYRMPVRVINEYAYQNMFSQITLIKPKENEINHFKPEFTVIAVPDFKANPQVHGTKSETFIILNLDERIILIGGTKYSGEIKKSLFTVMNYFLPLKNVLPMHCSANVGENGEVTLFFGLSGTGKTTLAADDDRKLIGDDEHGWSDSGIFNFEGGCYAKCINLSKSREPQIWNSIKSGVLLENVVINKDTKALDYNDDRYTENTRAAIPLENFDDVVMEGIGKIPKTIIFLTADATGILPPIAKLSKKEAMYYFLSGYTSKLAGTERGIVDPVATFSTCFGGPFMILKPEVYAKLLGEKIEKHNVNVFLVNTGWTGGAYGVGSRIKLEYTRKMVRAAINGDLDNVRYSMHPVFHLNMPETCPGVPSNILNPVNTWENKSLYYQKASELAKEFTLNFEKYKNVSL